MIGEDEGLSYCGSALDRLLRDNEYEFIDLYSHGIPIDRLENCGLKIMTERDENIIPNYFEPFVQENVDINFIYSWGDFRMFRGDGDQDRPSLPRGGEQIK